MTHASESQHWYGRDGSPQYDLMGANGKMRPATLRDARKIGLLPSVTTVIRCADRPALTRWMVNQAVLAALTLPRIEGETSEQLCERILRDSQEQAKKAAELGTKIHAAVQGHYEGELPHADYWPHVKGVKALLAENCGEQAWTAEQSFAHSDGFGGKCDLNSQSWVIDFKTKEFSPEVAHTLKTWDEHGMQLAAYREGLTNIDNVGAQRCGIVYISTTHPGMCRLIEIDEPELEKGWACFSSLLAFWKAKTGYSPDQWREKEAA